MTPKTLQISFFIALIAGSFASAADKQPADQAIDTSDQVSAESNKYLLRFKLREGDKLRYQTTQRSSQEAIIPGRSKTDRSSVQQKRLFRVNSVDDSGDARVSMQFEHVRMERQVNDLEPEVFDTSMTAEEIPPAFKGTATKLNGAAPTFTVPSAGTAVKDDGYVDVPSEGEPCFMLPLPKAEVAVGDTWKVYMNVKVRVAAGVKRDIRLLRTLKLKEVKDDIATISTAVSIATRIRSPGTKAQLIQATPQGEIHFDIARGRVISRKLTFDRSVLGAMGSKTILNASGQIVETLIDEDPKAVTSR